MIRVVYFLPAAKLIFDFLYALRTTLHALRTTHDTFLNLARLLSASGGMAWFIRLKIHPSRFLFCLVNQFYELVKQIT